MCNKIKNYISAYDDFIELTGRIRNNAKEYEKYKKDILSYIYSSEFEESTIVCEDANLYKVLKNSLNKYIIIGSSDDSAKSFSIPTSDIESITKLSLVGSGSTKITNLSGLENFTSLQELDLSENNIKDITPILNIKGITKLNLSGNKVGNISSFLLY